MPETSNTETHKNQNTKSFDENRTKNSNNIPFPSANNNRVSRAKIDRASVDNKKRFQAEIGKLSSNSVMELNNDKKTVLSQVTYRSSIDEETIKLAEIGSDIRRKLNTLRDLETKLLNEGMTSEQVKTEMLKAIDSP